MKIYFTSSGPLCVPIRCLQKQHLSSNYLSVQLVNKGPSAVSQSTIEVRCPLRAHGHELLYPVEVVTEGPLSCTSKHTFNALKLKVRTNTHTQTNSLVGMERPLPLVYYWPHLIVFVNDSVMSSCMQLQPPAAAGPTSLKSNTEHHIQRRDLYRDLLAEQGNLVRQHGKNRKSSCTK